MRERIGAPAAAILALAGLYFLTPLAMTFAFSLWEGGDRYGFAAYGVLLTSPLLGQAALLSLELSLATALALFALLVPATVYMNLEAPWLRPAFEFVAALPFVVPAIALVAGLTNLYKGPAWLIGSPFYLVIPYFFLALPYAYRAIDVGVRSIDLPTLTEAGRSLGAGAGRLFWSVILPGLRPAMTGAALLTLAMAFGEFTFSNVLLFRTYAVYLNDVGQADPTQASALSASSFLLTWFAMLGALIVGGGRAAPAGGR
ncbi:MAG: ABC transporter permease subunit [Hyphomicrobiales bacterium]|nr:ABC transporter permease subunit [Hyphomicrobiales bacterium]MDE2018635.1 ABC transporter permease subunit [Hyphomicrobiales bacterium]